MFVEKFGANWQQKVEVMAEEIRGRLEASGRRGQLGLMDLRIEKKFGTLVVGGSANGLVQDIVAKFKKDIDGTCEVCGQQGRAISAGGYWRTVCDEHLKEAA